MEVPFTRTVTPGKGWLSADDFTIPEIVRDCALAKEKANKKAVDNKHHFLNCKV
jgi:hypothetical protein